MLPRDRSTLRVGPAGWSYRDWSRIVYPKIRRPGFREAGYLAHYFDTLEINTSFYRAVRGVTARQWTKQIAHNPRFRFTAKLHQNFTHQGLPTEEDDRGFREMADVLSEEDRLGAVLMQFPWSFRNNDENRVYLQGLLRRLRDYPLAVEMRHASWNEPAYYDLLREHKAAFCNVDQPVIGESLKPSAVATSQLGYVRLHGRNYKEWFGKTERDARYDYLYSKEELGPWKDRVKDVSSRSTSTYVITNNHYQGQAVVNALELVSMLLDAPVPAPDSLVAAYPRLAECTITGQGRLF